MKEEACRLKKPYRVRIRKKGISKAVYDKHFTNEKCAAHCRDEAAKRLLSPHKSIKYNCDKFPEEFAPFIKQKNG